MNLDELVVDTRFLLWGATEYQEADIIRNVNEYHKKSQQIALKASKIWRLNKNVLTTSIVNGQKEYDAVLASPLLALDHIEINYDGSTDGYMPCTIIGNRSMFSEANTDNYTIDGKASEYQVTIAWSTLYLPITPTASVANGIKIYYQEKWPELRNNTITATVVEAAAKTLTITEISSGTDSLLEAIDISMTQAVGDTLAVTWTSATSTINIALANTTPAKNTTALIQAGIRALTSTGIVFTTAVCTGSGWTAITGATITTPTCAATLVVNDTPELDDTLHRFLSLGAAFDYTLGSDLDDKGKKIRQELEFAKDEIQEYYAQRLNKGRARITPMKPRYN